jgi:hypothetical protein
MISALTAWPRAAKRALSRRRRNAGLRAAIALGAYAGMMAEDHLSPVESTFASITHAAEKLGSRVPYTADSVGNLPKIYRFSFPARQVVVLGACLEDALEAAAAELPSGVFVDIDELMEDARKYSGDGDVDEDAVLGDLTYTESGYMYSGEWGVDDSSLDEEIDALGELAEESDIVVDPR